MSVSFSDRYKLFGNIVSFGAASKINSIPGDIDFFPITISSPDKEPRNRTRIMSKCFIRLQLFYMKKILFLIFIFSLNTWSGFNDICLVPNLDLTTVESELEEKACERNDILYVMTEKQTDLPFMMTNFCMYKNHEITQNVTQEVSTVYHLTCVFRGERREFRN